MQEWIEVYTLSDLAKRFHRTRARAQRHIWKVFIPVKITMAQTRGNPKGYGVRYAIISDVLQYLADQQKKEENSEKIS